MSTQHHVFLFRHCVRSTKHREKLHNNWTAFQKDEEMEFDPTDFVAESGPYWNTPEYWCTKTGMEIMEASGRFLFDQLVLSSTIDDASTTALEFQIIADQSSQRDVDSAWALLRGIRQQSLTSNLTSGGTSTTSSSSRSSSGHRMIQVKGLDRLHFFPTLFHQWDDMVDDMCDDKLKMSQEFRNRVRQEIQHRLDTIPPPAPGLTRTMEMFEYLAGHGRLGTLSKIPTLVEEETTQATIPSFLNGSSPFPILVSEKAMHLAGPVNVIKWFAEMAFYSRAGGVSNPFLKNATLIHVLILVEWYDWSRTILNVENSVAATKGSIMARGILDALTYGHVPYATEYSPACRSGNDRPTTATKVTLIVGHDSNMDAVATSLGLRWRLDRMYQEAPSSSPEHKVLDELTPTPPGGAMHFVVDDKDTVTMDFWYPVFLQNSHAPKVPTGMQLNTSGILERTPMILQARSDTIQQRIHSKLSADKTQMILLESGMEVLYAQLEATLNRFPDAMDCYNAFLSRHSSSTIQPQGSCLTKDPSVMGRPSDSLGATIVGMAGGSLVTLLIVMGWNVYGRRRQQQQGAVKVSTCEPVSHEAPPLEFVAA